MNRNIALFGGSFDPPHLAHPYLGLAILQTQPIDTVCVLPTAEHPTKDDLAPMEHRIQMCRRTFRLFEDIWVSDFEDTLPTPSYTVQTLEQIHQEWEFDSLYYVIGTDLAEEVPDWENAEGLSDFCTILLAPRQGYPITDPPDELGNFRKIELGFDLPELSSTFVRQLLRRGVDCSEFLDRLVYHYILSNGLYGT